MDASPETQAAGPPEPCPSCGKPLELCVCAEIAPVATRHRVLLLQHPREPDKLLGSARIANLALPGSVLKVGLSWPNLSKALGEPARNREWGVLYLGTKNQLAARPQGGDALVAVDAKGRERTEGAKLLAGLRGIIVLDGTWEQAKAMWWRNPWLLKLPRLVLSPAEGSLYGPLRREPRRECLSTIESVAHALVALGEPEATAILRPFESLIRKAREAGVRGGGSPGHGGRGRYGGRGGRGRRGRRRSRS